jgi:hypothetical protein
MKMKFTTLAGLVLGLGVVAARAQTTPPVLTNTIIEIDVSNGGISNEFTITNPGTGYANPPVVTITGGGGFGLKIDALISGGQVTGLVVDSTSLNFIPDSTGPSGNPIPGSGGVGFTGPPILTISGGGTPTQAASGATATAFLSVGAAFQEPFQNEVFGPAGLSIDIWSLAQGTHPASGFIYDLSVNGLSIGATNPAAPPGTPAAGSWTPPLPGVYVIVSATHDDDGNNATSQGIRYFATGTAIVSPEASGTPPINLGQNNAGPGTLVPVGSSLVIQATSTPADGFVSRIDFYTEWNGATGTKIGSAPAYPYSVIYTPAGPVGVVHVVKAIAYDNTGAVVPALSSLDQITLTMTTPSNVGSPTCVIVTPVPGSLIQIPDYISDASATIPVIVTAGAQGTATITKVELYINGVLYKTVNTYPYVFEWAPSVTGLYSLTALAYDNLGNVIASVPSTSANTGTPVPTPVTIEGAPAVAITSPNAGGTINSGVPTGLTAVAFDTNLDANGKPIGVKQVQFFQDGVFVGVASYPPTQPNTYTVTFKPSQNTSNGVALPSILTAIATDNEGFSGTSPNVQVKVVSGGTGNQQIIGTPPTISLVAPADQSSVVVNTPVTLQASANAPNGNVDQVNFLVNNQIVATTNQYPYSTAWTFKNLGTYHVSAQVIDNLGDNVPTVAPITINVVQEPPPTITFTSPASGGVLSAGVAITVAATAASPSGTVAQVQFFANGISIGTATAAPYTVSFTPPSSGVYLFTAIATDNAGEQTNASPVAVEAVPVTTGLGTTTYFGQYQGLTSGGRFAFIVVDGKYGTYISHSTPLLGVTTTGPVTTTVVSGIPVSSSGAFSTKTITGMASQGGLNGNLVPSQDVVIGASTPTGGPTAGYYTGNIGGNPASNILAIVGGDGSLMMSFGSGASVDVLDSSIDSTGAFSGTTVGGNQVTGAFDPITGFLTGTVSGSGGGTIYGGKVSGGTFSDGVLKNISTRGQVGTGSNIMIAGFAVGGTTPKKLLIRAVGPTLSTFNLSGSIPSTELDIYSGSTKILSNTGWSSTPTNQAAISAADGQVGAFALPAGSADSALVGTFAPGSYTAQISGLSGATGIALAEVYDLDPYSAFSPQRLINVSTRGSVGTGAGVLIGGFSINGSSPKRLLIRGAGPTLGTLGVTGALSAGHLELFDSSQNLIRENFSWQTGNDQSLVSSAETQTGAFAFGNNSADSAIVIVLPPGTYTAVLSGATSTTTGIALVEVYEIP